MINLAIGGFYYNLQAISSLRRHAETRAKNPIIEAGRDEFYESIFTTLTRTRQFCSDLELSQSIKFIDRFFEKNIKHDPSAIMHQLGCFLDLIESEGSERYVYSVKQEKGILWESFSSDWSDSIIKFPSAARDIQSATNCFVLDENTACVFHLMRTAEIGLRALARERRVKLPKRKRLEWAEWQAVLSAIDAKVNAIAYWRAGETRDSALEFYRGALGKL